MIWMQGPVIPSRRCFGTFEALCDYFCRLEQTLSFYHAGYKRRGEEDGKWGFVWHSYKRLAAVLEKMQDRLSSTERQAFEEELDLIDVFCGDILTARQYAVTPDLDAESLARGWCYDYASAHGFVILESLTGGRGEESGMTAGTYADETHACGLSDPVPQYWVGD